MPSLKTVRAHLHLWKGVKHLVEDIEADIDRVSRIASSQGEQVAPKTFCSFVHIPGAPKWIL